MLFCLKWWKDFPLTQARSSSFCSVQQGLTCLVPVMSLTSFPTALCLACIAYSHTGPLADFLTNQAHSCLKIPSEPLAPLPPGMCSSQPSVPEVMLKYPFSRDHPLENSIPLLSDFSLTLPYFCFPLLPPSSPSSDIFYICSHFSSLFSEAQWDLELDLW